MIKTYEYKSLEQGPTLLIFGAIHGNETCGQKAIQKIIKKLDSKKLTLTTGQVIFVPVSNPLAYYKNKRYIDEDLNRNFTKTSQPKIYEQKLANALCELVDRSDVLLDLHSTEAKGPPTIFLDFPTRNNIDLAKSTSINLAIVGWPELYQNDKRLISHDTTSYAHSKNKDCILVECGQHKSSDAQKIAEDTIIHTFKHYQLIKTPKTYKQKSKKLKMIRMSELFIKENKNDSFSHKWKHLEIVRKGDIVGKRNSGKLIVAQNERIMILPKYNPPVGKEWFYLGYYKK